DEARQLSKNYIGTEHLLLGLIREGEGLAGRVLTSLGITLEKARGEIVLLQDNDSGTLQEAPPDVLDILRGARRTISDDLLGLKGKSLLSMSDLSRQQIEGILQVSEAMAKARRGGLRVLNWKHPRSLAMIFEKPSLRTRVTF